MKISRALFLFVGILLVVGCSNTNELEKKYDTKGYQHISCKRDAEDSNEGTEVDIHYDIYYKGEYLKILKSEEKITSSNQEVLDNYEKAYKSVYSAYDNLKYYDNKVTRDSNSVKSVTYIHYGKIDMDQLLDIEGQVDNVEVTDGKIKLKDWKSFAKKYGTVCDS